MSLDTAVPRPRYLYKGFNDLENILLNIAGFCGPLVALMPFNWRPLPSTRVTPHVVAAVHLFLCVAAWVRINRPVTEGRLMHASKKVDVGDRVRVKLVRTDASRGFIDFEPQG